MSTHEKQSGNNPLTAPNQSPAAPSADSWDTGAGPAAPPPAGGGILSDAWHSARRWWKVAVPVGLLLATAAAAGLWFTFEHSYRASCWFKINAERDFLVFPTDDASGRFVETQIELVRSPLVLSPVVRDPAVAGHIARLQVKDPLDWLSSNVRARLVGESEFLEIAFESENYQAAKDVVEAVAESYRQAYERDTDEQRQQVIKLLEEEKNRAAQQVEKRREDVRMASKLALGTDPYAVGGEDESEAARAARRAMLIAELERSLMRTSIDLEGARGALRDFVSRHAAHGVAAEIDAKSAEAAASQDRWVTKLESRLAELNAQLVSASDAKRAELKQIVRNLADELQAVRTRAEENAIEDLRIKSWRESLASIEAEIDEMQIEKRLRLDSTLRSLAQQAEQLRTEIAAIEEMYKGKGSGEKYRRLKDALADVEREEAELREGLADLYRDEQRAGHEQLREVVLSQFDERVGDLKRLRAFREQYFVNLSEIDVEHLDEENARRIVTMDLEFAKRELEREEGVHQKISDRLLALRTEERAPSRVIRKTEEAIVVNTVTRSSLIRKMGLASTGAFLLPFGLGLLWDLTKKRVGDERCLRTAPTRPPLLAEIARLPATPKLFAPVSVRRQDRDYESFRDSMYNLTAHLAVIDSLADARVFAVTSAVGGEGKSTVVLNLASCLAAAHDERVLVIDGDLRAPSMADMMGVDPSPGLAEVLNDEFSIDKSLRRTANPSVFVLPAGEIDGTPHHLIAGARMKKIVSGLRKHFRYILIDTPPVLSAGEALTLAKMSDATLYCVLRDVSNSHEIDLALERLELAGCRPVGTILNGVPAGRYRGSYGYSPRNQNKEAHVV